MTDAISEIETLRRSLAAAKQVIKSKEAIQSIQNGRLKDMNEAINTLASEREANAVMTEEIETLRQRVKELEGYEAAWIETAKHRDRAERELAEFKIDNGLTIAYMSGFHDGKKAAAEPRLD